MKTLERIKADSMGDDRLRSSLFAIFAGMALLLAGMGLYGVISYSVLQRTREIGIRTALGATSANIVGLLLRSGMTLTCIGLVIGIGGAFGFSQFLTSMLFGIGKHDSVTLMAVGGILAVTALLACYLPARRATKVDPIIALRCE
jgi:putative ABC transport system permease protein